MAQQIVKKHIGSNAIDGTKIQLLQGQSLKALDSSLNVIDLIKLDNADKVLVKGQEVALASELLQEVSDRSNADAATLTSANAYADSAIAALVDSAPETLNTLKEIADQLSADQSVVGALTTTVANNLIEAKAYADTQDASNLVSAKNYADTEVAAKLVEAKSYTDTQVASGVLEAKTYADTQDASNLVAAKAYADTEIAASLVTAKAYTDSEVGAGVLEAKGYADTQDASNLVSAKAYADAAVLVEKNRAEAAEAIFTSDINSLSTRVGAVEGSYSGLVSDMDNLDAYAQDIRSDLDQEIQDRAAADTALSNRIDALETKPAYTYEKETFTAAAPLVSVTLLHSVVAKSLVVFVGRLALHYGVDYTVSVVSGKTVLTWAGDFAVGGVEAIEVGDVIQVTYAYLA